MPHRHCPRRSFRRQRSIRVNTRHCLWYRRSQRRNSVLASISQKRTKRRRLTVNAPPNRYFPYGFLRSGMPVYEYDCHCTQRIWHVEVADIHVRLHVNSCLHCIACGLPNRISTRLRGPMNWQELIVSIVVGLAIVFLYRHLKSFFDSSSTNSSSCHNCDDCGDDKNSITKE